MIDGATMFRGHGGTVGERKQDRSDPRAEGEAVDPSAGFDLVFVSLEPWDDVWRRNQFICAELARRYPGRGILFVTPPRDMSNAIRCKQWSRLRPVQPWSPAGLPNIIVSTPTKLWPTTLGVGRSWNGKALRKHVRGMVARWGVDRPVLWINDHAAGHLVDALRSSAVVYDITDDWTTSGQAPWLLELIRQQDAELCRRADAVIVCSQRLYDLKRPLVSDDRLHVIPNGVDADHYQRVLDGTGPLPAEAAAWPKPVLGYTGTIHPDRVDVALVVPLARAFPQGSVVLIGPNHLPAHDAERLARLGNVHLTGPRPYATIPDYMRAFDVCITPHRMTPFTESLNPIKLWEYLAAGKPIVSTDVAGFRDYPGLVRVARTAAEFENAIQDALSEDDQAAHRRRAEARLHSWEGRVDAVEQIVAGRAARPTLTPPDLC